VQIVNPPQVPSHLQLAPQRWIALQEEDRKKASFTAQAAAAALDPLPQAMVMMQQAQISMTPFYSSQFDRFSHSLQIL
jgi:hypothetical protein